MNTGSGLRALGSGFEAEGDLLSGSMTANSLEAQADLAAVSGREARQAGDFNAMRFTRSADKIMGRAKANFGASGVSLSGASATAIMGASAANAELDRLNILHEADLKGTNYDNQNILDKYAANSAMTGSLFKAAGTIIGGIYGGPVGAGVGAEIGGSLGGDGQLASTNYVHGDNYTG